MVAAVVAVVTTAVVFFFQLRKGPRPEEAAARSYLEAMLAGDADASYARMSDAYRSLVFPQEHARLVDELARTVGDDADVEILGSERSPGTEPLESLVGYKADTAAGPLEGVVTLYEIDDGWVVGDWSYDFVAAPPGATDDLRLLTRQLNAQLEARLGRLEPPDADPTEAPRDDASASPR